MDRIRPKDHESEHGVYERLDESRLRSYSASHLLNLKGGRFDWYPPKRTDPDLQAAARDLHQCAKDGQS